MYPPSHALLCRIENLASSMTIYEVVLESTPQLLTQWCAIAIDAYALGKHKTWEGEFRHQEISTIQVLSILTSTAGIIHAISSYVSTNCGHWFGPNCPKNATLSLIFLFISTGVGAATVQFRFFHTALIESFFSNLAAVLFGIFVTCLSNYPVLQTIYWRIIRSLVHSVLMIFAITALFYLPRGMNGLGIFPHNDEYDFNDLDYSQYYDGTYELPSHITVIFWLVEELNATRAFILTIICSLCHLIFGFLILPFEHAKAEMFSPIVNRVSAAIKKVKKYWTKRKSRSDLPNADVRLTM